MVWAYPQSSDDMVTSSRSHSHTKLPIEHGQTYHPMGNIRSSSMQSGCTLHYAGFSRGVTPPPHNVKFSHGMSVAHRHSLIPASRHVELAPTRRAKVGTQVEHLAPVPATRVAILIGGKTREEGVIG